MRRIIASITLCPVLLSLMGTAVLAHSCVDKDRDYWCDVVNYDEDLTVGNVAKIYAHIRGNSKRW